MIKSLLGRVWADTALRRDTRLPLPDDVKLTLIESLDDVLEFQRWLGERRERDVIASDVESTGLSQERDHMRLCQFGDLRRGWAMDTRDWLGVVKHVFARYEGRFVFHNAPFDYGMLSKEGVSVPLDRVDDTLPMCHILEPHMSKALKSQAARHVDPVAAGAQAKLDEAIGSRGGWTWATVPTNFPPYWQYGALDAVLTAHLEADRRPVIDREAPRAYELENGVRWVLFRAERYGAHIDTAYTRSRLDAFLAYCEQVERWCWENYRLKPGSNAAVIRALRADGFDNESYWTKRTEKGALALDKDVLEGIPHPLAEAVLGRRRLQKLASTYLENFLAGVDADDILHPSIDSLGARTSRMSMHDPNLQNLPRRSESNPAADAVRSCVSTRWENGRLLMCDFDQIEMRLLAHFSRDEALAAAFREEGDFFVNIGRSLFGDPEFTKKDPRRQPVKNCVPVDTTEILTQRGWLTADEVKIGDQTLGLDPVTRTTRWTEVTAVHRYEDAEVVRLGNSFRSFETTRAHRWVAEHERTGALHFITTDEQPGTPFRLVLAASCAEGNSSVITEQEAAVLGWVLSDGSIIRGEFTGATAQGKNGQRVKCEMSIGQRKPHRIAEIDALLTDIPHKRYSHSVGGGASWRLDTSWARSVLTRVGIHDKHNFDPWQVALRLGDAQRRAMIATLDAGDGGCSARGLVMITQASGSPVSELCVALGYLTGRYSRVRVRRPNGEGWQKNDVDVIDHQRPTMTGQRTRVTPSRRCDVWCVTTELGTWTMRQERTPVITGNSMYAQVYGAGVPKAAATAGVPQHVMQALFNQIHTLYPGIKRFQRQVDEGAWARFRAEGVAYARSPLTDRFHVADHGKIYALVNYLIQGAGAEVLKMKILEADAAGLGPWFVVPVHDELVLDVPGEYVRDAVHTLRKVMNDDSLLDVPVTASVSHGRRWGEKEEWVDDVTAMIEETV